MPNPTRSSRGPHLQLDRSAPDKAQLPPPEVAPPPVGYDEDVLVAEIPLRLRLSVQRADGVARWRVIGVRVGVDFWTGR